MNANGPVWIPNSTPVPDVSIGQWAQKRQSQDLRRIDFQVPSGFEAYCRILHRVQSAEGDFRWSDFASRVGVAMRPSVHWSEIDRGLDHAIGALPQVGMMDPASFLRFLNVVRSQFGLKLNLIAGFWDGIYEFGILDLPTTRLGMQDRVLFKVCLSDLLDSVREVSATFPGILWPYDNSWYMSTDTDYNSTIVGGTMEFVRELLSDKVLEVLPISLEVDLTHPRNRDR